MRRGKRERVCAWRNFPIAYEFESFVRRRRRLNNRVCRAREFRTHRSLGMGTCIRVLGGILGKFESLPTPSETVVGDDDAFCITAPGFGLLNMLVSAEGKGRSNDFA